MATERAPQPDEQLPYLDEVDAGEPITDDLPPITAEDIARTSERLEAGRETDAYSLGRSDLYVLMHLSRLGEEHLRAILREPSQLAHVLTPTQHA